MTQQNLRELARQGDPKVIASVINRTLQPKGITAQVGRDNDCLQVMLESEQVPSQSALMDFLRKGITNLGIESIQTVKIYGRQAGEDLPAWEDEIELMPANPMFYADEGEMPRKPVDDDDDDIETENYDHEQEYNPDEHDHEDEDEHELDDDGVDETASQKKQIPKVAIIGGAVFVVLLAAIAGLFFTGNLPFLTSSAPESPMPSPAESPKSPSPKPKSTASSTKVKPNNNAKTGSPSPAKPSPSPVAVSPSPVKPSPSPVAVSPSPSPVAVSPSPSPVAVSPSPSPASPSPTSSSSASPSPVAVSPSPASPTPKPDPWRTGVNKAQNAANLAQTSISKGEWEEVASEWEKAVQLMKAVPPSSPNYQKAQQKAAEYQSNLDIAQRRAAAAAQ